MRCVVVIGAGASRELGSDKPLPLMDGWAEALKAELEKHEEGLAGAIGLRSKISGEEFETTLGELFRWRDLHDLNARFRGLGANRLGEAGSFVAEAELNEQRRLSEVMAAINTTLFRLFGAGAIDEEKARDAYGRLLDVLEQPQDLVMVTTNYDPAIELAVSALGLQPETGFERVPGRAPRFKPEGLVRRLRKVSGAVPVLHLHGAVGWYEQRGKGLEHEQHLPFQGSNGRPVVLYPDPRKDPTRDALVHELWDEFDVALDGATHVIVIGHSLHDAALVARLQQASYASKLAICVFGLPDQKRKLMVEKALKKRMRGLFPHLSGLPSIRFGPGGIGDLRHLETWISRVGGG